MLISLLCAHEMNKRVRKISRLNSKRLLRKPQNMLEGYFILPHPVLFEKNVRTLTFSILWYAYILKPWSWLIYVRTVQCESKFFTPPLRFSEIFPKRLRIFNKNFTRLLLVYTYAKLQNFIQLSRTMTKLCRIKREHPVNFYISQHCHEFY